jgi:energy-coupling factor transport system permease protein
VNIAPRYLGRGSWLARRDPRVLILIVALFIFTVLQVWDERFLLLLLAIAVVYYRSASIPWRHIKRNWTLVFVFIGLLVTVNLFVFSGGEVQGCRRRAPPAVHGAAPRHARHRRNAEPRGDAVHAVPHDGDHRLPGRVRDRPLRLRRRVQAPGCPEKFAFGIDLTFRFLPSLARDFQTTVDAQRIRGFDWSAGATGFLSRAAAHPVVVPTVVNAIAGAEDTIDAMDLRAFGTGRRSWLRELRYDTADRLLLLAFFGLLVAFTILGFMGITSKLYVFPFLIALAGG